MYLSIDWNMVFEAQLPSLSISIGLCQSAAVFWRWSQHSSETPALIFSCEVRHPVDQNRYGPGFGKLPRKKERIKSKAILVFRHTPMALSQSSVPGKKRYWTVVPYCPAFKIRTFRTTPTMRKPMNGQDTAPKCGLSRSYLPELEASRGRGVLDAKDDLPESVESRTKRNQQS